MRSGNFGGKGPIMKYRDFLSRAVQKRLNWSICRLGCGFGWAQRSTSSIVFARWRQWAHMGGHIGATWWIRLNRLSASVMRSYVKLLWPLVYLPSSPLSPYLSSCLLNLIGSVGEWTLKWYYIFISCNVMFLHQWEWKVWHTFWWTVWI